MEGSRRNGHKRRSASFDPPPTTSVAAATAAATRPPPRTAASSTGRHRHASTGDPPTPARRAITPDVLPNAGASARSPGMIPSPSADIRTRADSSGERRQPPSRPLIPSADTTQRPRTHTLEDRIRKASPAGLGAKNRRRNASVNNAGRSSPDSDDPAPSSIGFPTIVSTSHGSTPGGGSRRLVKSPPPRPLSPPSSANQYGVPTFPIEQGDSVPSPTSDTSRIFSLMKTTCGRMHGILSFRTAPSVPWASGYCAINVASGSLIYQESKGSITQTKTLIPDLRGCQVRTQGTYLSDTSYIEIYHRTSGARIHLRPHVPETFASWLAALLCWQPLKPKHSQPVPSRPVRPAPADLRPAPPRRNSSFNLKDATTIKLGQMLYWDPKTRVAPPQSPRRISTYKQQRSASGTPWRRVSATLQSNGLLRLYLEKDNSLVVMVPLASLCRSAIQRLHPSVLEDEYCIGIYPQYTTVSQSPLDLRRPVYLSLENQVLFEAWCALFKAFTIPELYGPESSAITSPAHYVDGSVEAPVINTDNMFRLERTLAMRVTEAKLHVSEVPPPPTTPRSGSVPEALYGDYHAEVYLDGEIRGRTAVKNQTRNPFWREEYEFSDMPAVLRTVSVMIKSRNTGQRDWTLISDGRFNKGDPDIHNLNHMDIVGEIQISPLDNTIGIVKISLDDLERCKELEDWFRIEDERGDVVGELLLKIRLDESIVLMSHEYRPLIDLISQFSTNLTQQIVSTFPATELRQLPEILLNIFQVNGNATEWLASLVEEEIESIHKPPPSGQRFHFKRGYLNDSYDSGVEREIQLRDANKNANVEANLLFRGNSLLTKALDAHMKRVGKEYLELVLGDHMRDIDESDPDCEVDPDKLKDPKAIDKHWYNLIVLTENVWNSIASSVNQFPPELRVIFRRIRTCAEDRYGGFRRNVGYSSVSGFLFLRFLCAAVLNPKLFGLLKDHPRRRAQRTLTLMAKSLQTLANMTTFGGHKEPWMERMNSFLNTRRQEFKDFVDNICSMAVDRDLVAIPPNFSTPIQIRNRLPATSREGFPSLPYLLDLPSECASLVSIWIDATHEASASDRAADAATRDGKALEQEEEQYLVEFDRICHALRAKTREVLSRAEQLDRPSGVLEVKWEELVRHLDRKSHHPAQRPMRPQRLSSDPSLASRQRSSPMSGSLGAAHESTTSLDAPYSAVPNEPPPLTSPPPLHPGSAPPFRTRAPALASATGTNNSSPGDSPIVESSSLWSSGTEEDRFPPHALSWDDADEEEVNENNATTSLAEDAHNRAARMRRFGQRSLSGSQRSLDDEEHNTLVRRSEFADGSLSAGLSNSAPKTSNSGGAHDREGTRDRELSNGGSSSGRRGIDLWGFRKKSGAIITSPVASRERQHDKSRESDGERGTQMERGSSSGGVNGSGKTKRRAKLTKD